MKRFDVVVVVVVLVGLFLSAAVVAIAQVSNQVPVSRQQEVPYIVQEGDNLWALEGAFTGQPAQWVRLMELNAFLRGPGRVWQDSQGRTIVLIRPGEKLRGLAEMGIIPNIYPLDQLRVASPQTPSETEPVPVLVQKTGWPWWAWLLLVVLALMALGGIAWVVTKAIIYRDPVTAGPAMVRGGVTDETARQAFAFGSPNPHLRIRNVVKGRLFGAVDVRYGDGSHKTLRLNGQTGYRAEVSRDRGKTWNVEYMLQGCGNELRISGMQYIPGFGFRFVPDYVVNDEAEPQSATQSPATPAQAPAQVPTQTPPVPPTPAPTPAPVITQVKKSASPAVPSVSKSTPAQPLKVMQKNDEDKKGEKILTFRPAKGNLPFFVKAFGVESLDVSIKENGEVEMRFN